MLKNVLVLCAELEAPSYNSLVEIEIEEASSKIWVNSRRAPLIVDQTELLLRLKLDMDCHPRMQLMKMDSRQRQSVRKLGRGQQRQAQGEDIRRGRHPKDVANSDFVEAGELSVFLRLWVVHAAVCVASQDLANQL